MATHARRAGGFPVTENYSGAGLRKELYRGRATAAGASGNHRHLVFEADLHILIFYVNSLSNSTLSMGR